MLKQRVEIDERGIRSGEDRTVIEEGRAPKGLPGHLHEHDGATLRVYTQREEFRAREESRDVALPIDRHQMSHPAD